MDSCKKCGSGKPKFITGEVVSSENIIIDLGEDRKPEEEVKEEEVKEEEVKEEVKED